MTMDGFHTRTGSSEEGLVVSLVSSLTSPAARVFCLFKLEQLLQRWLFPAPRRLVRGFLLCAKLPGNGVFPLRIILFQFEKNTPIAKPAPVAEEDKAPSKSEEGGAQVEEENNSSARANVGAIVGAVVGVLMLIAAAGGFWIWWRRQRQQKNQKVYGEILELNVKPKEARYGESEASSPDIKVELHSRDKREELDGGQPARELKGSDPPTSPVFLQMHEMM